MKVLNEMETAMVSGGEGVCSAPYADQYAGVGERAIQEIGAFFSGLNQLGSDLGIWLYNMTHSC